MNCIWEIVLKAKRSVYKLEELRFINSKSPGPYTESSFDFLNYDTVEDTELEENNITDRIQYRR
jgi:hypothetical protein